MNALKREFIELARRSGWSQAEIARKLKYSRGGVNGIITGPHNPSEPLLELFRLKVSAEKPELLTAGVFTPPLPVDDVDEDDLRDAVAKLEDIHKNDKPAFKTIHQVIDLSAGRLEKKPISSESTRRAGERVSDIVNKVRGEKAKSGRGSTMRRALTDGPPHAARHHSTQSAGPPDPEVK